MHHQPDVRFINTHTKSIGSNHDARAALLPEVLLFHALLMTQTGMIKIR